MKSKKYLIAVWLAVAGMGLAGCNDDDPGSRTERNIDESMEEAEESLEEMSEEIEEDAKEE